MLVLVVKSGAGENSGLDINEAARWVAVFHLQSYQDFIHFAPNYKCDKR
jgi:hypothetical protein